jgi:hypothetical protein
LRETYVETYETLYQNIAQLKETQTDDRIIALMSILDKLFDKSLSGRLQSALPRGLSNKQSIYVPAVMEILRKAGAATTISRRGNKIWLPNKSFLPMAGAIMNAPQDVHNEIVAKVLLL